MHLASQSTIGVGVKPPCLFRKIRNWYNQILCQVVKTRFDLPSANQEFSETGYKQENNLLSKGQIILNNYRVSTTWYVEKNCNLYYYSDNFAGPVFLFYAAIAQSQSERIFFPYTGKSE